MNSFLAGPAFLPELGGNLSFTSILGLFSVIINPVSFMASKEAVWVKSNLCSVGLARLIGSRESQILKINV